MFRQRPWVLYLLVLLVSAAPIMVLVLYGDGPRPNPEHQHFAALERWDQFKLTFHESLTHPLAILLLQIITIIFTARVLGYICRRTGLPTVVGEIAAGIFLGPTFLAYYWPDYSAFLFPASSLPNLQFLSQIGLILFMFVVGMELDLGVLRNRFQEAFLVSHASIVFPFTLGIVVSYFMYVKFSPPAMGFIPFALFMGIAMSITAFPVLARIVQERGLSRKRIGALAITCAAVDDITAWCLLALVIAIVKAGSVVSALWTIGLAIIYVVMMLALVRPFLRKLGEIHADRDSLSKSVVAVFFLILLISAYVSEVIGIHALFGAFLAGVIMPANVRFRHIFIEKVEDVALVLLLPLFFVYTGLRTRIGLLTDPGLWNWTMCIVGMAVLGKFLGSALPARIIGNSWRDSLMLGALMNTRGLMELVVLNIGYDLGVLSPEVFAMMVVMALVTTLMTGPVLSLIDRVLPERAPAEAEKQAAEARRYKVLVPFGDPERGRNMVRVAHAFVRRNEHADVTALHFSPSSDLNPFNTAARERESFKLIRREAMRHSMRLDTVFRASTDIQKDVLATINGGRYDLAIVGAGRSIYEGTLLGRLVGITRRIIDPERLLDSITGKEGLFERAEFEDRVRQILRESRIPVGVYVDKGLEGIAQVAVVLTGSGDSFLLTWAQKVMVNEGARITFVDLGAVLQQNPELLATIRALQVAAPGLLDIRHAHDSDAAAVNGADLLLISLEGWKRAVEKPSPWLAHTPSTLILRP